MKMAFLSLVLLMVMFSTAWADEPSQWKDFSQPTQVCVQQADNDEPSLLAGRGCCSHHKGQCGCEGGRVLCCDGSLSPSCRCEKDEGPLN